MPVSFAARSGGRPISGVERARQHWPAPRSAGKTSALAHSARKPPAAASATTATGGGRSLVGDPRRPAPVRRHVAGIGHGYRRSPPGQGPCRRRRLPAAIRHLRRMVAVRMVNRPLTADLRQRIHDHACPDVRFGDDTTPPPPGWRGPLTNAPPKGQNCLPIAAGTTHDACTGTVVPTIGCRPRPRCSRRHCPFAPPLPTVAWLHSPWTARRRCTP